MFNKVKVSPEQNNVIQQICSRMYDELVKDFGLLKDNPSSNVIWNKIGSLFRTTLPRISELAYREGCHLVGVVPDAGDIVRIKRQAIARANQVLDWIKTYTYDELEIKASKSSKKKKLLGKKRAKKIVKNETYVQFYNGGKAGWRRNRDVRKEWVLGNEHGNIDDVCDDNAAQGPIPVNDLFQSGDDAPQAHINCYCHLFLLLPQNLGRLPGFRPEHTRLLR